MSVAIERGIYSSGYYYDAETGFYYLQSRYYDPVLKRFINADGYASTGQGFIGTNMFAYCNNNPVIRIDCSGDLFDTIFGIFSFGDSLYEALTNPTDAGAWIAVAGDGADLLIPFVSGIGESTRLVTRSADVIDDVYDATRAVDRYTEAIQNAGKLGEELYDDWRLAETAIRDSVKRLVPSSYGTFT